MNKGRLLAHRAAGKTRGHFPTRRLRRVAGCDIRQPHPRMSLRKRIHCGGGLRVHETRLFVLSDALGIGLQKIRAALNPIVLLRALIVEHKHVLAAGIREQSKARVGGGLGEAAHRGSAKRFLRR